MTYKQKVMKLAEENGCSVETTNLPDHMRVDVDAPEHHTFGGDLHAFVGYAYKGFNETDAMWKDLLERMEWESLLPCESNCDCYEEEE